MGRVGKLEISYRYLTKRPPLNCHLALDDTIMAVALFFELDCRLDGHDRYPRIWVPEPSLLRSVAQLFHEPEPENEPEPEPAPAGCQKRARLEE